MHTPILQMKELKFGDVKLVDHAYTVCNGILDRNGPSRITVVDLHALLKM